MFPRLRQQVAERLDLVVELATLGEYGLAADLRPFAICPEGQAAQDLPRRRDGCDAAPAPSRCRDGAPTLS